MRDYPGLSAAEIVAQLRISKIWLALGGGELRRAGQGRYRGRAWWRRGNGWNISLDDSRGIWYDFRDNTGGGIFDLVVHVRGGDRQDALRWLAEFGGLCLSDRPVSETDRARWAQQQRDLERELPKAQYWRRAAIVLTENLLEFLKTALVEPEAKDEVIVSELWDLTQLLERLKHMDGAELVEKFRSWKRHHPYFTAGMVYAAERLQAAEERALEVYLSMTAGEARRA